MKKILFILMAFMTSFSVYAQEVTKNAEEEVVAIAEPIIIETLYWDADYIAFNTVTFSVTFPTDVREVLAVSHPCTPGNLSSQYWSFGNGVLTVTYPQGELTELFGSQRIYIYARDQIFIIELVVS